MQLLPVFRNVLRTLRETLLAVLALGAGIGLTTTLFSIVKGVVWTSFPVSRIEELVRVDADVGDLPAYASQMTTLRNLAGVLVTGTNCDLQGVVRRLQVAHVSPQFFDVLQASPMLGVADVSSGKAAVLSHRLWISAFEGRRDALGRTLNVHGQTFAIAGVMPPDFGFPRAEDIWISWEHGAAPPVEARGRGSSSFLVGRLKTGETVNHAAAEFNAIVRRLHPAGPGEPPVRDIAVTSFADSNVKGELRILLMAVLVCCSFVLLIACGNVANLSLARAARRLHELGVRSALGASRGQLMSMLLVENLVLSAGGAAIGVAFAHAALTAFTGELQKESALTGGMPASMRFQIDPLVLAFVAALAIATALACGLIPAWRVTSVNLEQTVRSGGRAVTLRSGKFERVLIHVQLAASVLLLVGTGIMGSMWASLGSAISYNPDRILSARIEASSGSAAALQRLVTELQGTSGVEVVALTTAEHIERSSSGGVVIEGRDGSTGVVHARWQGVTPAYFDVLGSRLVGGRMFSATPSANPPGVAVVNRSFAAIQWPGLDPVGRRFRVADGSSDSQWLTVSGVVEDIGSLKAGPARKQLAYYVPLEQVQAPEVSVLVRSSVDSVKVIPALRAAAGRVSQTPLFQVHTAAEIMDMEAVGIRVPALLFAACGFSGLLLSAIGTYGILSLAARQRTRETGIRLALGATPGTIARSMILQGSHHVVWGVGSGLLLGLVLARVLNSLFESLQSLVLVNVAVAVTMAAVGFASVCIPALALSRVQPHVALRK